MSNSDAKPTKIKRPRKKFTTPNHLSLDLSNPIKAARVDWIIELYSLMTSKSTILRRLIMGRPEDDKYPELKPMSTKEAYRYYELAMKVSEKAFAEERSKKIHWFYKQHIGLARQAMALKAPKQASEILAHAEKLAGVAEEIIEPPEVRTPEQEMTDEQLDAEIALEKAKRATNGSA